MPPALESCYKAPGSPSGRESVNRTASPVTNLAYGATSHLRCSRYANRARTLPSPASVERVDVTGAAALESAHMASVL